MEISYIDNGDGTVSKVTTDSKVTKTDRLASLDAEIALVQGRYDSLQRDTNTELLRIQARIDQLNAEKTLVTTAKGIK